MTSLRGLVCLVFTFLLLCAPACTDFMTQEEEDEYPFDVLDQLDAEGSDELEIDDELEIEAEVDFNFNGEVEGHESNRDGADDGDGAEEGEDIDRPAAALNVLVLTTEETRGQFRPWHDALGAYGIGFTVHTTLADEIPTQEQLRALAEDYDVALLTGRHVASTYASPVWNELPMGLVTTEPALASGQRWGWLDVGDREPTRRLMQELSVEDPHSVLYGLKVGDGAKIALGGEASAAEFFGYRRDDTRATNLGFGALSFGDEGEGGVYDQFILWEPGPFFEGGDQRGAGRRAMFGMESGGISALNEEGKRLLAQTLEWAAREGHPRRRAGSFDPVGLLLTWQNDPTTTMTIDWHTLPREEGRPSKVRYWVDGTRDVRRVSGTSHGFPHSQRTIHRVELEGLEPDTLYLFDFGDDSRVFRFRTMPTKADRPIHFITGGDVRHTMAMMNQTSLEAHRHSPAFVAWGGDLAYANGRADQAGLWYEFFESLKHTLINGEGLVIPVIVAIGNHEVRQGYYTQHEGFEPTEAWRREIAPYFYDLFAFPGQPGYEVLDFGDYMSWVILDTNHTNPIEGPQVAWLDRVLRARRGVPHVFPLYHVPAYPSVRGFIEVHPRSVRESFVPLFEAHGIRTAFENHDHTYKRTKPIRGNAVSDDGIVYLGDGAWGVSTRPPRTPQQEWYLANSRGVRHFIVGTIDGQKQVFRAFDEEGRLFDEITR